MYPILTTGFLCMLLDSMEGEFWRVSSWAIEGALSYWCMILLHLTYMVATLPGARLLKSLVWTQCKKFLHTNPNVRFFWDIAAWGWGNYPFLFCPRVFFSVSFSFFLLLCCRDIAGLIGILVGVQAMIWCCAVENWWGTTLSRKESTWQTLFLWNKWVHEPCSLT